MNIADTRRATRLLAQAAISEHNRRVRLAQRPDADARMAAAKKKRGQRNAKRAAHDDASYRGRLNEYWRRELYT